MTITARAYGFLALEVDDASEREEPVIDAGSGTASAKTSRIAESASRHQASVQVVYSSRSVGDVSQPLNLIS